LDLLGAASDIPQTAAVVRTDRGNTGNTRRAVSTTATCRRGGDSHDVPMQSSDINVKCDVTSLSAHYN